MDYTHAYPHLRGRELRRHVLRKYFKLSIKIIVKVAADLGVLGKLLKLYCRSKSIPDYIDSEDVEVVYPGKRLPTAAEAVWATLDRYEVIDSLHDIFSPYTRCAIYGGSMSHGPFFNVRSGSDASDIDLIMAINDQALTIDEWSAANNSEYLAEGDRRTFAGRLAIFRELNETRQAELISQRFNTKDGKFNLSIHFMTQAAIEKTYGSTFVEKIGDKTAANYVVKLRDYKAMAFERQSCTNFDCSGNKYDARVKNTAVPGGFVARIPAYAVVAGRYVPSLYQCLALPNATVAYAIDGVMQNITTNFHDAVRDRVDYERYWYDSEASLVLSNPRRAILTPACE